MKNSWIAGLLAFVVAFTTVTIAADSKIAVDKLKCVIAGEKAPAKADKTSDWKDGKVFFCCDNCKGKFEGDKKKFAAQANHQLIASKQVEQKACPFSGGAVNKEKTVEFKGATMAFCCDNCKGKAEKMTDDQKVEELFGEKAYEKAKFAKVETK